MLWGQLVRTNIHTDFPNFIIYNMFYTCFKNYVFFADLYSSQGKGLLKNSLNEEQTFFFELR